MHRICDASRFVAAPDARSPPRIAHDEGLIGECAFMDLASEVGQVSPAADHERSASTCRDEHAVKCAIDVAPLLGTEADDPREESMQCSGPLALGDQRQIADLDFDPGAQRELAQCDQIAKHGRVGYRLDYPSPVAANQSRVSRSYRSTMIAEHEVTRWTAADGLRPGARGQLVDLVGAEQAERDDLVIERPFANHRISRSLALGHVGLEMIAAVGSSVRPQRSGVEAPAAALERAGVTLSRLPPSFSARDAAALLGRLAERHAAGLCSLAQAKAIARGTGIDTRAMTFTRAAHAGDGQGHRAGDRNRH